MVIQIQQQSQQSQQQSYPQQRNSMPSGHTVTLTTGSIQRKIIKMKRVIEDLEYYDKYYRVGHPGRRSRKNVENAREKMAKLYVTQALAKSSIIYGIPCYKCDMMIEPGENCVSRYRRNQRVPVPSHYHERCYEELYH